MTTDTRTNNVGRTMDRVVVDGVDYGFMVASEQRRFFAALEARRSH